MARNVTLVNSNIKISKRVFDLFLAIFFTLLAFPGLVLISLLIKLTSKGPIIFSQKRIGKDKKIFHIYKFRTMYISTPKDVPTHLLTNTDSHITPLGKFLRKSSLDEIPQLFNIIKGDMAFVGPRPALYNQYDLIDLRDKHNVNSITPGITGWAQINGRDEIPLEKKAEYDRYYYENMSFWFDFKIAFSTVFKVLGASGVVEGK